MGPAHDWLRLVTAGRSKPPRGVKQHLGLQCLVADELGGHGGPQATEVRHLGRSGAALQGIWQAPAGRYDVRQCMRKSAQGHASMRQQCTGKLCSGRWSGGLHLERIRRDFDEVGGRAAARRAGSQA